jgi:hypothetical protein
VFIKFIVDEYGFLSYHTHVVPFQSSISTVHFINGFALFNIKSNQAQTVFTVIVNSESLNLAIQSDIFHISILQLLTINSGSSI